MKNRRMKAGCCCPQSPNCATVCAVHPGSFCLPPLGWELGGALQHPCLSASCSRMTETLSQGTQAGLWGGRGKTLGCVVSCSCPTESQLRCPGRGTKEAEMSQRLQEEKEPECVSECVCVASSCSSCFLGWPEFEMHTDQTGSRARASEVMGK